MCALPTLHWRKDEPQMNMRNDIGHIAAVAAMLLDMLGSDPDETAFLDTLEGETDALDLADALIAKMQDDDAMAEAIKAQIDAMAARRHRIKARVERCREAMLALIDAMGVKKLERPRATISRRAGAMRLVLIDPTSIPSQLCDVETIVTPDKAAIKAALDAGEAVPGAALERGPDGLTVRIA
jgi:hypothetical protein